MSAGSPTRDFRAISEFGQAISPCWLPDHHVSRSRKRLSGRATGLWGWTWTMLGTASTDWSRSSVPEGENYQYFTERGDGPPLFGYRRRFWSFLLKLAKARPAWTVPANPGPSTGPFHWESRPLAPEEMLRLQTFPVWWKLEGRYRAQIRQAGNATPPLLAEMLGRVIASQLFGVDFCGPPTLAIPRAEHVPPPVPPKPVAPGYMSLTGQHAPHPGAGLGPRPRRTAAPSPSGSGEFE